MIKCKPYKTSFLTSDTCIARQKKLIEIRPSFEKRQNTPPAAYQKIERCDGCEDGLSRYKAHLEQEKITGKMRRCSRKQCLKLLPADLDHFGKDAKGKDGLSYYCRECQKLSSQNYQAKKKLEKSVKVESVPKAKELGPPKLKVRSENKKTDIPENIPDSTKIMHTCTGECKKSLELTPENFQRDSGKALKFRSICKICTNKSDRARKSIDRKTKVIIDFAKHPELLEKLNTWAGKNMRSVDQQLLFFLKNTDLDKLKVG